LAVAQKMNSDLWSYGLAPNETTLSYFLTHHHRQGLSSRQLGIQELFHPATTESYSL
jgi:4,5-dihydroxyphthalate decarboxylase